MVALLLADADNNGVISPGDTIRYKVFLRNSNSSTVTEVRFHLLLDQSVLEGLTDSFGKPITNGEVSVSIDALSAGEQLDFTFDARIKNPLPTGTTSISSQGTVSTTELPEVLTDDPDTDEFQDPTVVQVALAPFLRASKGVSLLTDADGNGLPSPGDTLSYLAATKNFGNSPATGVVFNDTPDSNTTLVENSVTTNRGTVTSGNAAGDTSLSVDIGTIPVDATVIIRFRVVIKNPLPAGTTSIVNQGVFTSAELPALLTDDPRIEGLNNPTVVNLAPSAVLLASKRVFLDIDPDHDGIPSPSDTLGYQVIVQNTGNSPATGVVFYDTPDSNTTLVADSVKTTLGTVTSGNAAGSTSLSVNIGTLPAGESAEISFQVVIKNTLPPGTAFIYNQGTVASTGLPAIVTDDPTTETTGDPTVVSVLAAPTLHPLKQAFLVADNDNNGFPSPGDTLDYQVLVLNTGNIQATEVVFYDTPDSNTTLVADSVKTDHGTVTSGNAAGSTSLSVNIGTLPDHTFAKITFRAVIKNTLPPGTSFISNQGIVSSAELPEALTDDPDTEVVGDPTVVAVTSAPVLSATKSDDLLSDLDNNGFPGGGDTLVYRVVIHNSGNSPATGVVFNDTPDSNTTLVANLVSTSRGTVTSGNAAGDTSISVNIGTLPAGDSAVISFWANIKNPLPDGTTFVSNQGSVSSAAGTVVLTDDPDTEVVNDPTVTYLLGAPIFQVGKSAYLLADADGNGFPSAGDTLSYGVFINNYGNSPATGVVFNDTPDSNTALMQGSVVTDHGTVTSGNAPGSTSISVDIGAIPVGTVAHISYDVVIKNTLPAGTSFISNQGAVSSAEQPEVFTDDPFTEVVGDATVVAVTAAPTLHASKQAFLVSEIDNNGFPSPNDVLGYRVIVHNSGNSPATGVVFNDTPDSNTTLDGTSVRTSLGTATTSADGTSFSVNIGVLPAGEGAEITFLVTVKNPLPAGTTLISNQGVVASAELPEVLTDNPFTEAVDDPTVVVVTAAPYLWAGKRAFLEKDADKNGFPSPGDTLSYEVHVPNFGNSPATSVVFNDTPDANTTLVAGSVRTNLGTVTSGNAAGDTSISVNIGTLQAIAIISFQVVIKNPLPAGTTIVSNQGSVTSAELPEVLSDDPDTHGIIDPTVTSVTTAPVLQATKQAVLEKDADKNGFPSPGDTLGYSVAIDNDGNSAATGVIFNDTPDANTTLVAGSVKTSLGTVTSGNAAGATSLSVNIGALPADAEVVISFQVVIKSPLPAGTTRISNQGTVTSTGLADVKTDNPATETASDATITNVTAAAALRATKRAILENDADKSGSFSAGDTLGYEVVIRNDGNSPATEVVFTDTPDTNTAVVANSLRTSQGTVVIGTAAGAPSLRINVGVIPPGGSVTISFRTTLKSPLPTGVQRVLNQGVITAAGLPALNTDDPTTTAPDDITITGIGAKRFYLYLPVVAR